MAVENWINSGEPNLGILITVNNKRERRIYPNFLQSNSGIYRPFLLIYDGTRGEYQFINVVNIQMHRGILLMFKRSNVWWY